MRDPECPDTAGRATGSFGHGPTTMRPLAAALVLPLEFGRGSWVMTHKYRGCIIVLLTNKSIKPNKEQKVLTSSFDQGFTVNTSKRVFRGIW
jgi:hypothetical protein